MRHYVRLALLPGNRHGPMDVDMVIVARNIHFFVFIVVVVVVVVVAVVIMVVMVWRTSNLYVVTLPRGDYLLVRTVVIIG